MNKNLAGLLMIGALIVGAVIVFIWGKGQYNDMVGLDESVKSAWSQVENQYQRRFDLIPNLVETVKGYATHERETLENVTKARASVGKPVINLDGTDPAELQKYMASQGELSNALSRLLVVAERYPALEASESFKELQAQLEGTENRISVERKRFNDAAKMYNEHIRRFPANLLAGMFGFEARPYFQASGGAASAPAVDFSGGK